MRCLLAIVVGAAKVSLLHPWRIVARFRGNRLAYAGRLGWLQLLALDRLDALCDSSDIQ